MPSQLLLNIPDAAKTLSVSRGTINNLLNSGALTRVKIGKATRITVDSVNALAQGRVA